MRKAISEGLTAALCTLGLLWLYSSFVEPVFEGIDGLILGLVIGFAGAIGYVWREQATQ